MLPLDSDDLDRVAFETLATELVPASRWLRAINYLVDYGVRSGIAYLFAGAWALLTRWGLISDVEFSASVFSAGSEASWSLTGFVVSYAILFAYYAACEYFGDGRTVGKIVTGTRAVRTDGTALTGRKALTRSLWRLVPFEILTFLAGRTNGWHDEQTGTMVVRLRGGRFFQ